MKVTIYMATTVNGKIAMEDDSVPFVSEDHFERYSKMVEQVECVIIGRRTYEEMPPEEFEDNCKYVVLGDNEPGEKKVEDLRFTEDSPVEILEDLKEEGVGEVMVAGGGHTNSSFLRENLVDEIILDLMPVVMGRGIDLFREGDFNADLRLRECEKVSPGEVQLRYRVLD